MTTQQTNNGQEKVIDYFGKKHVFLGLGFVVHFFHEQTASLVTINPKKIIENYNSIIRWIDLLYRSHVHLILDDLELLNKACPDETNENAKSLINKLILKSCPEETNENVRLLTINLLNSLLNNGASTSSGFIESLDQTFANSHIPEDEQKMRSILLTGPNYSEQAQKMGLLNVRACNIREEESLRLFRDIGPSIRKGVPVNWEDLLVKAKAKHNCNSMVIIDNYVDRKFDKNLKTILEALLPKDLSGTFHLSIFTSFSSNQNDRNPNTTDHQQIRELQLKQIVEEWINTQNYGYPIALEIFNSSPIQDNGKTFPYFHDREIVTNHIWIGIGGGFDIIKDDDKSNKLTHLESFFPSIVTNKDYNSVYYWDLIKQINYYLSKTEQTSINRLLKHYYGEIFWKRKSIKPYNLPLPDGINNIRFDQQSEQDLTDERVKEGDIVSFEFDEMNLIAKNVNIIS